MNDFFGNLSDEDYVKKRSCLSEASSSLLVIKSPTGQRKSVGKKNDVIIVVPKRNIFIILP